MPKNKNDGKSLDEVARLFGVGNFDMHLFLCTGPDCISEEDGQSSWKALKSALKEAYPELAKARIYRTKVGCLRMCREGPIAVCYPQGKWFRNVTADRVEELVAYLESGVEDPHELEFIAHPLPAE